MKEQVNPEPKQKLFEFKFVLHKKRGRTFRGVAKGKVEDNIWHGVFLWEVANLNNLQIKESSGDY